MSFLSRFFKDPNKKVIDGLLKTVEEINGLSDRYKNMSDDSLRSETERFKKLISDGATLDSLLPEAFASVREAAFRTLGMRHFDVQLMGGIILHRGQITEMKTGEGKTLTSTLAIYLNALNGRGVHVVTVNDYLAARDSVWMGQIFDFLGMRVSCIQNQLVSFIYDKNHVQSEEDKDAIRDEQGSFKIVHDYLRPCSRKDAYQVDIIYGTNNEFGFDYLRDNMAQNIEEVSQRDLAYAIIDEIDSILIDEARTPLIISAPAEQSASLYSQFSVLVHQFKEHEDYNIDEKMRSATLTEGGIRKVESSLGVDNLYVSGGIRLVHHLEQALKAYTLFKRDIDYVVQEGQIIIVDEFTGRLMPGRRYSEGLHQAIEAKEGVEVQRESRTLATITFQNLFRLYEKLGGMTGTAATEAEEFQNIYGLEVVTIPTNREMSRIDLPDKIFKNESGKFNAIVETVKELHKKGQPVLIGTVSIEKNENLSSLLHKSGVPHQILNAKNHEREAEIIAQAGKKGAVTVATNMAGRGVDIVLGGNPCLNEESLAVKSLGGLYVIGTERHESRRIDNQLRGRSGRQGDTGTSQFYISMDDDVMRIFGSDRMKSVMNTLGLPDDMPIENKFITRSIESAQKRVEGHNFDTRKHVLEYDDVLNKHRTTIYQQRKDILTKDDLSTIILDMIEREVEQVVSFHTAGDTVDTWNIKEITEVLGTILPLTEEDKKIILSFIENGRSEKSDVEMRTALIDFVIEKIKKVYKSMGEKIQEMSLGVATMSNVEKTILLRTYDTLWVEHLDAMHHMRIGIGLRGYGQRDPLVEYKKEAFRMFSELQNLIQKQITYSIFKISFEHRVKEESADASAVVASIKKMEKNPYEHIQMSSSVHDSKKEKVGRNELCSCGSGKKYKRCHGA